MSICEETNLKLESKKQLKNCEEMHIWVKPIEDYIEELEKALERAKKEHELLGLYREYYGHIPYSDNPRIKYCEQKIDELEKELEELK